MKILFTSPIIEYPAKGGPELRITNSIKALSEISDLYIIQQIISRDIDVSKTRSFFEKRCVEYHCIDRYPPNKLKSILFRLIRKAFLIEPPGVSRFVIDFVKDNNINIIWFGYGNISYPLIKSVKKALPEVKIICDTDSVWSRFISREIPFRRGLRKSIIKYQAWRKRAEERKLVLLSTVTTAVSEVDAKYYESITDECSKVHIFSNVLDIDEYRNAPRAPAKFRRPCVYLAGSYGLGSAMNMATDWMLDNVLPILIDWRSDIHFYIVGKGSELEYRNRESCNITVTGRVDSVLPFLCNADVAVVPLKFESGTRFKILEAGACKVPIVSTTLGAEGIPVKNGKHLLIADSAEDFASAIIDILRDEDLGRSLANQCFKLVNENYSVGALKKEANNILGYINYG